MYHSISAASQKLEEELLAAEKSGSVFEDGRTGEKPAPNGVAAGGTKVEKKEEREEGKEKREEREEGKKKREEGKKEEDWRQSLQEGDMIQTLDSSPKTRRTHSSESERKTASP